MGILGDGIKPVIVPRTEAGNGYLRLKCIRHEHNGEVHDGHCLFRVSTKPAHRDGAGEVWQWDGDLLDPTITPSVQCLDCGLHVVITKGVESGRPAPAQN